MSSANSRQQEAAMDRFGLKVAAMLDEPALPHDISERLRIARQQALAQRKMLTLASAPLQSAQTSLSNGTLAVFGSEGSDGLSRLLGALPLLALLLGLLFISDMLEQDRAVELANVDVQLLTDDLPPDAHTDPGFAQFLKFGPPSDVAPTPTQP